jgi:hypothetical protein
MNGTEFAEVDVLKTVNGTFDTTSSGFGKHRNAPRHQSIFAGAPGR